MTCPKEAELALYAGTDAPNRRIARVERHVARCPRCARRVAEFGLIRAAVASSGSQMPASARDQVRAEILSRISGEPMGRAGRHPLVPIVRIACIPIVVLVATSLVPTLRPPAPSEFPLGAPFGAHEPPPRAFVFADRPASSSEPMALVSTGFAGPGNLESARLSLVERSDGRASVLQLHVPAKDPSLEIRWIIE